MHIIIIIIIIVVIIIIYTQYLGRESITIFHFKQGETRGFKHNLREGNTHRKHFYTNTSS